MAATKPTGTQKEHPILLTPGPLTTAAETRQAMQRDWGSRDRDFIALTRRVREALLAIAGAGPDHVCVPLQGSGTFAVEAMIGTLLPPDGHLLVEVNGAYGRRIAGICARIGRAATVIEAPEDRPFDTALTARALTEDASITHIAAVHCETTSGVLNPLAETAELAQRHGKALLVDAMSSFGALPLDAHALGVEALAASSNKCLEGAPGLGFVIARRGALERVAGQAHSVSLDLSDQWQGFEKNGQWRFTPPTHIVAALDQALTALASEGGPSARLARYGENRRRLVSGMRALGFQPLLADADQAPIIVTFRPPADPSFDFDRFYDAMLARGFAIYPGKLTHADSFRIGCIGAIGPDDMDKAVAAVTEAMKALGWRI